MTDATAQPVPAAVPPPKKKSSCLKWLLGCGCGCLLLLFVTGVVGYFFMGWTFSELEKSVERGKRYAERQKAAGGSQTFVNSPNKLDGDLKKNYADFSFNFSRDWSVDSASGNLGAPYYVKMEHNLNGFTVETLAIGDFSAADYSDARTASLLSKMEAHLQPVFENMKKIDQGNCQFGKYDAYQGRYRASVTPEGKEKIDIWFRIVYVKNTGGNGVAVLMIGSNTLPEIKSIEDIGEKGDLAEIVQSFEFK